MHVLPRPLPAELVKGEHFVLEDLLKLILGRSLQIESAPGPLVRSDCLPLSTQDLKPAQLPSARRDSQLTPQATKKNKRNTGYDKVIGAGLEGLVD